MGARLIVGSVQATIDSGKVQEETGANASRNRLQTTTLIDTIEEHQFDACIGGARRDEEKARAKERFFSHRDDFSQWDPKNQRPELWNLFNGKHASLDAMMQPPMLSTTDSLRNEFHKRQLGTEDSYGDAGTGPGSKKRFIAYPKPFLLDENGEEHYGDKIRVFAKCVNGGRPHEPIDIMLCTQSL